MKVPIGFKLYSLRLAEGRLVLDGESCASVCDHHRQEILVSNLVPEASRMHVAAAAVSEAWAQQIGLLRPVPFVGQVN